MGNIVDTRATLPKSRVNDALNDSNNWEEGLDQNLIFNGDGYSIEITRNREIYYRDGQRGDVQKITPNTETFDSFAEAIREKISKKLNAAIKEISPSDPRWKRISQSNPSLNLPDDYSEIEGFTLKNGNLEVWIYDLTRVVGRQPVSRIEFRASIRFGPFSNEIYDSDPHSNEVTPNRALKKGIIEASPEFQAVAEIRGRLFELIDGVTDWRKDEITAPHWRLLKLVNQSDLGVLNREETEKAKAIFANLKAGKRLSKEEVEWLKDRLPESLIVRHERQYGHFSHPVLGDCTIRIEQVMTQDERLLGANVKIRQRLGSDQGELTQRVFLRITDTETALKLDTRARCLVKGYHSNRL